MLASGHERKHPHHVHRDRRVHCLHVRRPEAAHLAGIPPGEQRAGDDAALSGIALRVEQLRFGLGIPRRGCRGFPAASGGRRDTLPSGPGQEIDRHPRVELRGCQIDVPEHLLNDSDVGTFSSMSVATPLAKRWARAADCGTRDLDLPWANCASRAD